MIFSEPHLEPPDPINCPECYREHHGVGPEEEGGADYDPEDWTICKRHGKEKADELAFERAWEERP